MQKLTNEQKAKMYNTYLFQYQRLQEQIRQIKMKNFEVSEEDQRHINYLEAKAKNIYNLTENLYR